MILKAENISKQFIRVRNGSNILEVIKDFSIEVDTPSITVIMGESGKGKTTLLNMLSGLLSPTDGKVMLDDKNLYELSDKELSRIRYDNFGVIPQGSTLLKSLSILDNVLLPLSVYNEKITDEVKEKAMQLLEKLGVADLSDIYPNELSGGEIRRVAVARSLIHTPKFIFADEPTSDLDKENKKIILDLFESLKAEGISIIMVTHDESIREMADKLIEL